MGGGGEGDQVFTMFTLFVKFCSFSEVLRFP